MRQQQVLLAIQRRTAGMDLMTALPTFARDLNGHVNTDLDLVRLTQLMLFMRGLRAADVHQAFITPSCAPRRMASKSSSPTGRRSTATCSSCSSATSSNDTPRRRPATDDGADAGGFAPRTPRHRAIPERTPGATATPCSARVLLTSC